MFKVLPFQEIHAEAMLKEEINKDVSKDFFGGYLTALKTQTTSFTFCADEEIVAVGGVARLWAGRGYVWMILSEKIKKHPVTTYRGLRNFIKTLPYQRLEMDVPAQIEFDDRRARFMGFKLECPVAKRYSPTGEDRAIYAWVRD